MRLYNLTMSHYKDRVLYWTLSDNTVFRSLHQFLLYRRLPCLLDPLERLVRGQCAECSLHLRIDKLQAVDITGIDPAETVTRKLSVSQ